MYLAQLRGQLTTSALRNSARACQTLKEHACQISDTSSMESAAVFMEGGALPVHSQVVTGRAKKISENRRKISSIVMWVYIIIIWKPPYLRPYLRPWRCMVCEQN